MSEKWKNIITLSLLSAFLLGFGAWAAAKPRLRTLKMSTPVMITTRSPRNRQMNQTRNRSPSRRSRRFPHPLPRMTIGS